MQVRVPQLLDFVAHSRKPNEAMIVLIVGSPLFRTIQLKETAFNMDEGLVPGDGMVLATRTESLFGVRDRKGS